jgi:hypothetical protein
MATETYKKKMMTEKYDRSIWKNIGDISICAIIIIFHVFLSCFPICSCRLFFTMFLLSIFSHVPVVYFL